MKTISLVFLFVCIPFSCCAIDHYCVGDTLNCFAVSGLKLREAPRGKPIATVLLGEKVVVDALPPSEAIDTFESIEGFWLKVRCKGQIGYVFDGYLSTLPAPSPQDSTLLEYLERVAEKVGKKVTRSNNCPNTDAGEASYAVDIQLFQGQHFTAKHISYLGWENGHISTTFDDVSLEEIVLLCRVVFHLNATTLSMPVKMEDHFVSIDLPTDFGYDTLTIKMLDELDRQVIVLAESGY